MPLAVGDRKRARVYQLPGRDWSLLIGPQNSGVSRLTLSLAIFPPGSAPAGHVHEIEEEVVYVLSGEGEIITPDERYPLSPGVVFWVPPGLEHGAACTGSEPLELLCAFSPPVVPGGYEHRDD